jgi:hypothetical protein
MTEDNKNDIRDDDFKYIMSDTGTLYLGARFSYEELLAQEMTPFKLKTIIRRYILKEAGPDTTLESQFYYLEKDSELYEIFSQLRIKVKVNVQMEKRNLFGKVSCRYVEKVLTLKQLTELNLAKKKGCGMLIREIAVSKLGLMTFNV